MYRFKFKIISLLGRKNPNGLKGKLPRILMTLNAFFKRINLNPLYIKNQKKSTVERYELIHKVMNPFTG